jgi:hypothetical protein
MPPPGDLVADRSHGANDLHLVEFALLRVHAPFLRHRRPVDDLQALQGEEGQVPPTEDEPGLAHLLVKGRSHEALEIEIDGIPACLALILGPEVRAALVPGPIKDEEPILVRVQGHVHFPAPLALVRILLLQDTAREIVGEEPEDTVPQDEVLIEAVWGGRTSIRDQDHLVHASPVGEVYLHPDLVRGVVSRLTNDVGEVGRIA